MRVAVAVKAEWAEGPRVTAVAAEWLRTAVGPVQAVVDTSAIGRSAVYLAEAVLLAVIERKAVSVVARRRAAGPRTFVVGFR